MTPQLTVLAAETGGINGVALTVLIVLFLPTSLFWATYEQQGNTIPLWADDYTDRHINLLVWHGEIPGSGDDHCRAQALDIAGNGFGGLEGVDHADRASVRKQRHHSGSVCARTARLRPVTHLTSHCSGPPSASAEFQR